MDKLYLDFETYSECNIKEHGAVAYANHPSTSSLCFAYAFGEGPVELWTPKQSEIPITVREHIHNNGKVVAFNATFEWRIWNLVLTKDFDAPLLSLDQMIDAQALAQTYTLHGNLEQACEDIKSDIKKNPKGKALVKLLCKPNSLGQQPMPWDPQYKGAFLELFLYCKDDVESMRSFVNKLPRQELLPKEHEIWKLTVKMNDRGLPVSLEDAKVISKYVTAYIEQELKALPKLTGHAISTIGQVAKIVAWCNAQGYPIPNLQAGTLTEALADADFVSKDPNALPDDPKRMPDKVRQILVMRQELGRTSTAKYKKLINLAVLNEEDHEYYVHDNLKFHGASPGRWTGMGFQMQNLPRATCPNPDKINQDVIVQRFIQEFYDGVIKDPMFFAKALIRPMIKAPKGYMLMVSDFHSIENILLHWVALDYETLQKFRESFDQYIEMASARYNVHYNEVTKSQRQMGKVIILGCIAKDTLVLTDSGPVPIQEVSLQHKLWDGKGWVPHEGLLNKGFKLCSPFNKSWMTHDHEVFITDNKEQVRPHLDNTQSENQAVCLAIGKSLNSFPEISLLKGTLATTSCVPFAESVITKFWLTLKKVVLLNTEFAVEKQSISLAWKHIQSLRGLTKKLSIDLSTDGMRLRPDALCLQLLNMHTTEAEVFRCTKTGYQTLLTLLYMLWDYPDLITLTLSLTESIMTGTMNPETLNSVQGQKIYLTHDILNAGKNHRFTILTPNGPVLVSNCGYGMGWKTFKETAKVQFGMVISEEEAKLAIQAYREKYNLVKTLWNELKRAAVRAVVTGQKQTFGRITFGTATVNGIRWLAMRLPSGKSVYYMSPTVEEMFIPEYEHMGRVPTITHWGINSYSKKWCRLKLIPGRITENAIQGTAREAMAQGMLNIENEMPEATLIGTVHDEALSLIKESDITNATLTKFNAKLCTADWLEDCPITANGYIAKHYRKE